MDRKSIARSRKLWAAILASISALVPILDASTGIDLVALVPALDQVVLIGFNLASAVLVAASILRPDKHGKEPALIADRR